MISMAKNSVVIELDGLTKKYGYGASEYYALNNFDLKVRQGEFVMIMGPSGCGKTTLLNMIGLLDSPSEGKYYLNGNNVARMSARRKAKLRSREIGFVFQSFNLINDMPIIENVALPLVYAGFSQGRRLQMASEVLKNFSLSKREYYKPYQLSGGQQQRVAIARSLVARPSIILADEPTGNLDSRTSHVVMEELSQIHQAGNTIIMVTHNPSLLGYSTRVINMIDGRIDTDEKIVADHDLPTQDEPEKIMVRLVPGASKIADSNNALPPKRPMGGDRTPIKIVASKPVESKPVESTKIAVLDIDEEKPAEKKPKRKRRAKK